MFNEQTVTENGIIDRIKGALAEMKETSKVDFRDDDPLGFIAYAFLKKEVEFIDKFVERDPSSFNGSGNVKYFGTMDSNEAGRETVLVLYYNDPQDFAVQLKCKQEGDELILARVKPERTLAETIQSVEKKTGDSTPAEMSLEDKILIPVIDFDLEHHFSDLVGARLGGKLSGQFIADAVQFIKYNLDAEGARLRSEAAIHTFRCAIMNYNRSMMFNEPFLLYMKQSGSDPYFAMWVHDDTYLSKGE